jgi:hypothetical protein
MNAKEGQAVYAAGSILIVAKDATLPNQCLRCGETADGGSRRFEALWNPHFRNPVGGGVGAVARVATNKRGVFRYFLCDTHRLALKKRMLRTAAFSAVCFIAGFVGFFLAIPGLAIPGLMLGIFSGVWILLIWYHGRTPANVVYIDDNYIYLHNAPSALLQKLPTAPASLLQTAKAILEGKLGRVRRRTSSTS